MSEQLKEFFFKYVCQVMVETIQLNNLVSPEVAAHSVELTLTIRSYYL